MKKELLEVVAFAVHVITGTLMFLLVVAGALGVGLIAEWVDSVHYSSVLHYSLKFIEYAILFADCVLMLIHVYRGMVKFCHKD